jgi:competence ComEA-like helix-hairpin-helix protein
MWCRTRCAPWAVPSSDDRKAALILLGLAAAGILIRAVVGGPTSPGAVAYRQVATTRPGRDSVAERAARMARPLARGETVDVDVAPASELARLPRIGPALAARIVAEREEHGAFGSLAALDRVSGVGPAVLEAVRRHVAFSGLPAPASETSQVPGIVTLNTASAQQLARLPAIGPMKARAIVEDRRRRGPFRRLEELTRVRGIGQATVERLRGSLRVP